MTGEGSTADDAPADDGRTAGAAEGDRIAHTPQPPYTAVIFTSVRTDDDDDAYARAAQQMAESARVQPGYLGFESARTQVGITVSYWADETAARAWKQVAAHLVAQHHGRTRWYVNYRVRIATVHRDYGLER